ncbi:hypothetical protein C8R45DRAFT_920941 [Mycena sanguinolenta]|nr:hypothetical protein C8R45DRAFT_920941 [Mycena sanguinolenta]
MQLATTFVSTAATGPPNQGLESKFQRSTGIPKFIRHAAQRQTRASLGEKWSKKVYPPNELQLPRACTPVHIYLTLLMILGHAGDSSYWGSWAETMLLSECVYVGGGIEPHYTQFTVFVNKYSTAFQVPIDFQRATTTSRLIFLSSIPAADKPPKNQHGGSRVGSARKSKEWHAERKAKEAAACAVNAQDQPPIAHHPHPILPLPRTSRQPRPKPTAPFFQSRSDTHGVALQPRPTSHPHHGLQVAQSASSIARSGDASGRGTALCMFSRKMLSKCFRQKEFEFLDLNDPTGGRARSDDKIDEGHFESSGSAEDESPKSEADATAAAEETENLKPPPTSVLHAYLRNSRFRILDEIKVHGQLLCYLRGDLWASS